MPAPQRQTALTDARIAFAKNRVLTDEQSIADCLALAQTKLQELGGSQMPEAEAEAPQQEEGKTRYVFRDGKMVEITGEGRQRDKAKVDAIWSSDIMRRHQSLIRRQQRLGMF
uniref:Uncharacterized protein n=1 Tax=Eutreptiella gymnastica TaxID=73025 RepID=A0A7S4G677_9EUGL